ncbi:hypothetical protein NPIL_470411, partial [Nephila pilipes]
VFVIWFIFVRVFRQVYVVDHMTLIFRMGDKDRNLSVVDWDPVVQYVSSGRLVVGIMWCEIVSYNH